MCLTQFEFFPAVSLGFKELQFVTYVFSHVINPRVLQGFSVWHYIVVKTKSD